MNLSPAVIRGIAKHLQDYEQEILHILLAGGLSAKRLAIKIAELSSRQIGYKMRSLARRSMVEHVPSPAGAYWCLTEEGKQVANFLQAETPLWKMTPPDRPPDRSIADLSTQANKPTNPR